MELSPPPRVQRSYGLIWKVVSLARRLKVVGPRNAHAGVTEGGPVTTQGNLPRLAPAVLRRRSAPRRLRHCYDRGPSGMTRPPQGCVPIEFCAAKRSAT